MTRHWIARALTGIVLAVATPTLAQPTGAGLPPTIASGGVTQAQWDAIRDDVRAHARRAGVAEVALLAAAEAAGARLARSRRLDAPTLQQAISDQLADQANRIAELRRRLDALAGDAEPTIGAIFAQARTALNEGRLVDADSLLAQVAERDLADIQQADVEVERRRVRAANTIAARAAVAALEADFPRAAGLLQRAADAAPTWQTEPRARYMLARASVIGQAGQMEGDAPAIHQAVQFMNDQLRGIVSNAALVASVQSDICAFEHHLAQWEGAPALSRAAAACNAALQSTPTTLSNARASASLNYGNVLSAQRDWEGAARAYDAARSMNAKLGHEADAMAAAVSHATALAEAGAASHDPARLQDAIHEIQQVIASLAGVRTAAWAGAYMNLGIAQVHLSDVTGEIRPLLEAQFSYLQAVNFFNNERTPANWARANKNFGLASERIAAMAINSGRREIAVQALQNVIRANENVMLVRTRERDPHGWEEANEARTKALASLRGLEGGRP